MAEWKELKNGTMPPVDNLKRFLLLRGKDPGDQLVNIAARVYYEDTKEEPYIRYVHNIKGWTLLKKKEYKDCLWQEIEYP